MRFLERASGAALTRRTFSGGGMLVGFACLLCACGGPYAKKGRYGSETTDKSELSDEAYNDLASVRTALDYDAITDFVVECVVYTARGEQLVRQLNESPTEAYGAREELKKRAIQAGTRCLSACPRVQNASTASERDRTLGAKYAPRCAEAFDHGALQLTDGERAMARAERLAAEKNFLEAREALMEVETCLRALTGENSPRQSKLGVRMVDFRRTHEAQLLKAESFARDPWVVATRGRLRAIGSERVRIGEDPAKASQRAALEEEESELSKQLFERRQQAGL